MDDLKIDEPIESTVTFSADPDNWVMKLTREGIFFNRERYPDSSPDDFAQAVINILENSYTVKFTKEGPPYDKKEFDEVLEK